MLNISRRSALGLLGAVSLGQIATPVFAQGQENRKFIFILLVSSMPAQPLTEPALILRRKIL